MAAERCLKCPYGPGAAVGPRGPEKAEVCVVGEAPGTEELKVGEPFIGPSGKLLSAVLTKAGFDPGAVFFTNAMRCRPPVGEAPPRETIEACRDRLVEEVTRHPRRVVIALGNSAVRSLTREHDSKITQVRGRARKIGLTHETDDHIINQVITIVPAYHPAYILRNGGELKKLQDDVNYARELAGGAAERGPVETEWFLAEAQGIGEWLDFLSTQSVLSLDIETGTEKPIPRGAFMPGIAEVLCLAVSWEPGKAVVFPGRLLQKYPKRFARFFASSPTFIWHNGKFDTSHFGVMGYPARVDEDTMLMHYDLSEGVREAHDLKQLAADYLGADPDYDAPIKKAAGGNAKIKLHGYYRVPKDILYPYAALDADYTLQLYSKFSAELNKPKATSLNYAYEHILLPASTFLRDVERAGVWVDRPTVAELRADLSREFGENLRVLREETGNPHLNPNSPPQVLDALHDAGFNVSDTRKETIKDLPQTPLVTALTGCRKLTKSIGTYVDGILERIWEDGRIHATYKIHGTVTGRLSSSDPNMQNIPREARIRNIFQAPEGKVLIELDYSQAELRVLAVLSGDPGLREVYLSGRDLHDEVSKELYPGWENQPDPVLKKEQRIRAKFVNFGIAYGRGPESLVEEFHMEMRQAKQLITRWWGAYPGAHRYIFGARRDIRTGVLESPFGRRRRFALIPDSKKAVNALENEAANFAIQSTASDLTLLSAMKMHDQLVQWDAHIINLVHDSILIESTPSAADEVGAYAKSVMEASPWEELGWDFPFTADYKVATRWGDLK